MKCKEEKRPVRGVSSCNAFSASQLASPFAGKTVKKESIGVARMEFEVKKANWSQLLIQSMDMDDEANEERAAARAWLTDHAASKEEKSLLACLESPSVDHERLIRDLLACGADAKAVDKNGQTALMLAAHHGELACLELLLPCSDAEQVRSYEKTALFMAVRQGNTDCARVLLAHAPRTANMKELITQMTPLMVSATLGNDEVARLLAPMSDIRARSGDGRSALAYAIRANRSELMDFLWADSDIENVDGKGGTALMHAIERSAKDCIPLLMERIDPKAFNRRGETALMIACSTKGMEGHVRMLLPHSDLEAVNAEGKDALRLAIIKENWAGADEICPAMPITRVILANASAPKRSMPKAEAMIEAWSLGEMLREQKEKEMTQAPEAETPASAKKRRSL